MPVRSRRAGYRPAPFAAPVAARFVALIAACAWATPSLAQDAAPGAAQGSAQTAAQAAAAAEAAARADAAADARFAHLARKPGGPSWSIGSIAARLPAGKLAMSVDPTKSVPPVTDAEAALKAATNFLAAADRAGHEAAFRVAGATVNATKHPLAVKLFAYLQFHGVGTRADANAAIRTALHLVRTGEPDGCAFVAALEPKTFASVAARATSIRKLLANRAPGAYRLEAPIAQELGDNTVLLRGDAELNVKLPHGIDRIEKGRVMQVAGMFGADGKMVALVAEVPEPDVSFTWKLVRRADRGSWQLRTVTVTVRNTGVQHVKDLSFKVRCSNRTDDHTQSAEIGELAPGRSRTVDVSFDMYNWYWGVNTGDPRAEVTVERVAW